MKIWSGRSCVIFNCLHELIRPDFSSSFFGPAYISSRARWYLQSGNGAFNLLLLTLRSYPLVPKAERSFEHFLQLEHSRFPIMRTSERGARARAR